MNKIIRTSELDYANAFISTTDDDGNTVKKKLFAPIFRIKNTYAWSGTYTRWFLNFTVWWESCNRYSVKTYTVNASIASGGNYKYIFKDETPHNQEFEVVALSDKTENGYTTYYVTFPTGNNTVVDSIYTYDSQYAQIVINKCDLLQNIELLGARPFNVDITTSTLTLYRDSLPAIAIVESNSYHHINSTYINQAFIRNDVAYVNYGIYTNNNAGAVGDLTEALTLTGIKPIKKVRITAPYTSSEGNGVCAFVINTDGTIDIEGSQKSMNVRLEFILDKSKYKIS